MVCIPITQASSRARQQLQLGPSFFWIGRFDRPRRTGIVPPPAHTCPSLLPSRHASPVVVWGAATGAAAARGRSRPGVIARAVYSTNALMATFKSRRKAANALSLVGRWIGRAGGPWSAGAPAPGARVFVCTCFSLVCTPLPGPAAVAAPGVACSGQIEGVFIASGGTCAHLPGPYPATTVCLITALSLRLPHLKGWLGLAVCVLSFGLGL